MENPVIIFGAKGLGKPALEIFMSNNVVVYGLLDDDASLHGTEINEVTVLGNTDDDGFLKLIGKKCEAFIATDDMAYRKALVDLLIERRKVMPVNAVHPDSTISKLATIGHGNFVNAGARIGAFATMQNHCIINSNAVIEHNCQIADFVQIGAGSIINSDVIIEKNVFIGAGVTIISGIKIGKNARIGAGSVVLENVAAGKTVFGYPAVVKN